MSLAFWENVNREIKKINTTQEWLSTKAGIKYMTFKGWVAKDVLPRVDDAVKLSKALGVSVEFLISGKDESTSFEEQHLLNQARKYHTVISDLEDMDEIQRNTMLIQIKAVADACRQTARQKNG